MKLARIAAAFLALPVLAHAAVQTKPACEIDNFDTFKNMCDGASKLAGSKVTLAPGQSTCFTYVMGGDEVGVYLTLQQLQHKIPVEKSEKRPANHEEIWSKEEGKRHIGKLYSSCDVILLRTANNAVEHHGYLTGAIIAKDGRIKKIPATKVPLDGTAERQIKLSDNTSLSVGMRISGFLDEISGMDAVAYYTWKMRGRNSRVTPEMAWNIYELGNANRVNETVYQRPFHPGYKKDEEKAIMLPSVAQRRNIAVIRYRFDDRSRTENLIPIWQYNDYDEIKFEEPFKEIVAKNYMNAGVMVSGGVPGMSIDEYLSNTTFRCERKLALRK